VSLTVRDLRDRIAAGIAETLGPDGWNESPYAADLFPYDSRELGHHVYAVAVPSTAIQPLDRQNSRAGAATRATLATSTVVVRWAHGMQTDDHPAAYAEALEAEASVVAAVLDVDRDPDLGMRLTGLRRSVGGDGTIVLGEVVLEVLHRLPLVAG
jgi:hypothetical protein